MGAKGIVKVHIVKDLVGEELEDMNGFSQQEIDEMVQEHKAERIHEVANLFDCAVTDVKEFEFKIVKDDEVTP